MKGYKVLNKNMRDIGGDWREYKLGTVYELEQDEKLEYSRRGFHFATRLCAALDNYIDNEDIRVFICDTEDSELDRGYEIHEYKPYSYFTEYYKICSRKIKLERELSEDEIRAIVREELNFYMGENENAVNSIFKIFASELPILNYDLVKEYIERLDAETLTEILRMKTNVFVKTIVFDDKQFKEILMHLGKKLNKETSGYNLICMLIADLLDDKDDINLSKEFISILRDELRIIILTHLHNHNQAIFDSEIDGLIERNNKSPESIAALCKICLEFNDKRMEPYYNLIGKDNIEGLLSRLDLLPQCIIENNIDTIYERMISNQRFGIDNIVNLLVSNENYDIRHLIDYILKKNEKDRE